MSIDTEQPCRECGGTQFHFLNCKFNIDEPSPVLDSERADFGIKAQAGYQRRSCSQCGEGLGFTESDPCERCEDQATVTSEPNTNVPERCPKCNDPDFVREQGCLQCGWALSDQIEPEPGICQRGVDGSKGCGHPPWHLVNGLCTYRHESGGLLQGYCGHKCDFSPSPITQEEVESVAVEMHVR